MKKTPISARNLESTASNSPITSLRREPASSKRTLRETGLKPKLTNGSATIGGKESEREMDVEQVLAGLLALKKGNFNIRLPVAWTGIAGKVADTFNEVAELMSHSTDDLSRISRVVGKDGRIQ